MKVKPGDKVLLRGCGSYRGSPRFIVAYQQEDDTVSILKVLEKEDLGERSDIHR